MDQLPSVGQTQRTVRPCPVALLDRKWHAERSGYAYPAHNIAKEVSLLIRELL